MVCQRCKMVVAELLEKTGLHPVRVDLGEIELQETVIEPSIKEKLQQQLQQLGFELLNDENSKTISKLKTLIINLVHTQNNEINVPLSEFLTQQMHCDYSALSNLFSQLEGITIERFYILQKIEKVKELVLYNELTLSQIASQLNYSSASYLSNQFKKETGLTPSQFKSLNRPTRHGLDEV